MGPHGPIFICRFFFIRKLLGTLAEGHYIAKCRSSIDGNWYNFDDGHVRQITSRDVLENKVAAYVLFYLRRDHRPETFTEYTSMNS